MTKVKVFFLMVWMVLNHAMMADEIIIQKDGSKAEYYLSKFQTTETSDSAMKLLNLAITFALEEENQEALVDATIQKAREFGRLKEGDSSSYYFEQAMLVAQELSVASASKANAYKQYGNFLSNQNQYAKGIHYLDTAALMFLQQLDTLSYADVLSMKGALHDNNGNEGEALNMYLKASKIYEAHQDSVLYAGIINNVAVVYKKLGDLDGALEYYERSASLHQSLKDTVGLAIARVNRGMLLKDLGQLDDALRDVSKGLSVFEAKQMSYGLAVAHHNLAEIHLALHNLDAVLSHVDQSQKVAIDMDYWIIIVSNQMVLAKALRDMGRPDISNKSALRAYELALNHGFLEKMVELTELLAVNYDVMNDHSAALKYFKEHRTFKDSLLNKESQEQINRLRTQYDVQQKEEDIKNLELINSYQSTLAAKEEKLKYVLEIGILLSLLVMILFVFLYRRQRKLAKKLSLQKTQLTGLNKEKDDLIAMVAHDLRSPLNNIKGLLGIIHDAPETDRSRMVELANQSTDVLRNRINQILDVEAINVGKINLKIGAIEVSDILIQLTRYISPEAEKKQISFYTQSSKQLTCKADENYLLQILENLCTNAIKFSKKYSEIHVKVIETDSQIRFEVQDQGQGIPEKEIKKLFMRYAEISSKPTENESSTGLGLPIVKKYAEAMGGKVWCESELGKGSSFFVALDSA